MYKYLLQSSADSINWMGIMVLVTFVVIFLVVLIQVFFQRKTFVNHMSQLPLDDSLAPNHRK